MTEEQLDMYRLKVKLQIQASLLRGVYVSLARTFPNVTQSLLDSFEEIRKKNEQVALPNLPAGYSDMLVAEYQEACEEALSYIESGLRA